MNSNMNPAEVPSWLSREKQESGERRTTYPFSTQFTFFNEGYFSAHEVRGACALNSVLSASKTVKHILSPVSLKPLPKIRPKDRLTIPCVLPIRIGPIKYADVTLILTYRRWRFSLWDTEQRFHYNLERLPRGEANWLRQPL
jgi:hypothetical protein